MSRNPADIGRAPVDVFVFQVEDHLRRIANADGIAARRVDNSLWLAGSP